MILSKLESTLKKNYQPIFPRKMSLTNCRDRIMLSTLTELKMMATAAANACSQDDDARYVSCCDRPEIQ
jgi:hypothetical protein